MVDRQNKQKHKNGTLRSSDQAGLFRENIKEFYAGKKQEIKKRLLEFKQLNEDDAFYELCFCILTPQSSALKSDACIKKLRENDFIHTDMDPKPFLKSIRFHNNKTRYLLEAKAKRLEIMKEVRSKNMNMFEIRDWLASNVNGIGMKEASHFLRNTGVKGLAILDRHILKNMVQAGVIQGIPKTLGRKKYLELEFAFKEFSQKINIPFDELDLVLWGMNTGFIFK